MLRRQDKSFLSYLVIVLFLVSVFGLALFCFAPETMAQGEEYENSVDELILPGVGVKVGLVQTVVNIVNIFLGLLGLIAVILIIYGGFVWMTAQGRSERVETARKIIVNAIIGVVIILLSYLIVKTVMSFVLNWADNVVNPDPIPECTAGATRPNECKRCSGSGFWVDVRGGVGFEHCKDDPNKDFIINQIDTNNVDGNPADNVRLCSNVQTIFNNSINKASIDAVKDSDLKIVKVANATETQISQADNWKSSDKYLNFKQTTLYDKNSEYKIYIPKTLKNNSGKVLSNCLASPNCSTSGTNFVWTFKTGQEIDDQKPTVTNTKPANEEILVPLSPYVKIQFDEEIDATTVTPDSVQVFDSSNNLVDYITEFDITSRKVSFSFIQDLNEFETYIVEVKDISDLCNNVMEDYEFTFTTGDQNTAVNSNYPKDGSKNVCPDEKILFNFSTSMEGTTVTFGLYDGSDRTDVVLFPGETFKFVPNFGELKMIDNDFTAYEFSPASLLAINNSYHVYVETDKQIDMDGGFLEFDWKFKTSTQEDCSCSPYISYLRPSKGGPGQCFTIFGKCFVGKDDYTTEPKYINFDKQPVAIQAGTWDDRAIVATAPSSLTMDGEKPRKVSISITATQSLSNKDVDSNERSFYVTTNEEASGPCLYNLSPNSGKAGRAVTAKGTRFGTTQGQVVFLLEQAATILPGNWGITEIKTTVSALAQSGNVVVRDSSNKVSNPIYFDVRSDYDSEGDKYLRIINDSRCEMVGSAISVSPSPNPRKESVGICRNVVISAKFNKLINDNTVNSNNIKIFECGDTEKTPDEGGCDVSNLVQGDLSVFIHQYSQEGFRFVPNGVLKPNHYYKIDLSKQGLVAEDGTMFKDQYNWYFKVQDSQNNCDAKYIDVEPSSYFTRINGEKIKYQGFVFADNCVEVPASNLNWTWNSSEPTIAVISSSKANVATTTIVGGTASGETYITANTLGKEDKGKLTYDPDSCLADTDCLDYYGNGSYICTGSVCDITTKRCKPVIHSLSPDSGPIGRWTTVHGCYFESSKAQGKVTFNDKEADYPCNVSWDDTQIIVGVPTDAGGSVKVETSHKLLSNTKTFSIESICDGVVFSEGTFPGLCSLYPNKQMENKAITLKGENLLMDGGTRDWDDNENQSDCSKDDQNCDNSKSACEENFNYTELGYESSGNPACCGDDSQEQYLDESSGKFCSENEAPICCSTALASVKNGRCVTSCDSDAPFAHKLFINQTEMTKIDIWEEGGWGKQDKIKADVPEGATSGNVTVELLGCPSNSIYLSVIGESCDGDNDLTNGQCSAKQSMCGRGLVCNNATCICEEPVVPEAEEVSIIEKKPTRVSNCTNLSASVLFSQPVKSDSLNDNLKLWESKTKTSQGCILKTDTMSLNKKEGWWQKMINKLSKLVKTAFAADDIEKMVKYWCPMDFNLQSEKVKFGEELCTNTNESDCTRARIQPMGSFQASSEYMVTIEGGENGIESVFGGALISKQSWEFSTTDDATICKITKIEIVPGTHTFTEPNKSIVFRARAMSNTEEIETTSDYEFEWEWSKKDEDNVIKIEDGSKSNEKRVSADDRKNGRANLYATALIVDKELDREKWERKVGSAAITVFLCENPVFIEDDKTTSKYETMYCKDNTQLPALKDNKSIDTPNTESPLLAEKFLIFKDDSGDAIGIRVYKNKDKLSSAEWYNNKVPNPSSSLQKIVIDGYDAVKSGRTVYVTAANHIDTNVYYNMYIMSYNDGASNNITNILNQLIDNWQFNNNITDFDKRDALHNDVKRLYHLGDLVSYLEKYKIDNTFYPKLEAGSYIQHESTSVWPSWDNELGKALKETLPVDPINTFAHHCVSDSSLSCWEDFECPANKDRCVTSCPSGYDSVSCWHNITREFACPNGSHIYWYESNADGDYFSLYANMEYEDANWSDAEFNTVDRNNNDTCIDLSITN